MSTVDHASPRGFDLVHYLRTELAPFPGRLNVLMRCVVASAIVIVIAQTLEVPELALSLLVVFYVTQSNVVVTRLVGAMFIVGSTLAIGTSIVLLKYTYDVPLVRIVVASGLFFASVYLMRVLKIGIVFFIVAIVVIYSQTFVDRTDQAETLVRAVLWVWVAVNYPILLTLLINAWLLPVEPGAQLRAELIRKLKAVEMTLGQWAGEASAEPIDVTPAAARQSAVALPKLLKFQAMREHLSRDEQAYALALVATVSRIYRVASELPAAMSLSSAENSRAIFELRAHCEALIQAIGAQRRYSATPVVPGTLAAPGTHEAHVVHDAGITPVLAEMQTAFRALAEYRSLPEEVARESAREPFIAPDAWTNPAYARFSLKTLLAVLLCYVFYNSTDWQGAHTIMLTCLIVALPSLGASAERALLRVGGAAIGSLIALLLVVFVIPQLESITGLLLAVLPVIAFGSWIAAGSERIGYAGVQIVFTCSLALFEHFGPTIDLTEIRDRMMGIALGVIVATIIQMSFWREGESDALHGKLAKLQKAVGALVDAGHATPQTDPSPTVVESQEHLNAWSAIADCEATLARIAFEPSWQEGEQDQLILDAQAVIAQARDRLTPAPQGAT
ncbi:multidrug resistance protein MdtO [Pararobbsia alpina]|uniref:FUSC family protein n=1 Tax=Pararobbsia alpina TaxID=621374 RepID=UPI0039A42268